MIEGGIPYDLKYGPLVECLTGRNQTAWLSDYPPEIAKHFQCIDEKVLSDYMAELERDFYELYAMVLPVALTDIDLAKRLVNSKDALKRLRRLLRGKQLSKNEDARLNLRGLLKNMQELQLLVLRPGM
jgi:hypothetical protein